MNHSQAYSQETRTDGRWTAAGLEVARSIVDACHVLSRTGPVITEASRLSEHNR